MWSLDDAITFARELQPNANAAGWFIALAGGVLNRGSSSHDLDIVAVPMSTARIDVRKLRRALVAFGMVRTRTASQLRQRWRRKGSDDRKLVEVWRYRGKRVDVIVPRTQ